MNAHILKELVEIIHGFLLRHSWVTLGRETSRMRFQKLLHPQEANDIIRLIVATVYIIRTSGKKQDFHQLIRCFHQWIDDLYTCPLDELEQYLDHAAEDSKRRFFHQAEKKD